MLAALAAILLSIGVSTDGLERFVPPPPPVTSTELGQAYDVQATLNVGAARLDVVETISLANEAALPVAYVNLSVPPRAFGYVTLGDVTVGGKTAVTSWTTGTNLRVELGDRLAPGETADVVLVFSLVIGPSGGAFTARTSADRGVLSFGQWLPMVSPAIDSYGVGDPRVTFVADRIAFALTTTQPLARDAVACPGLVEAPAVTGTAWRCEIEHARDFSFVVNPRFHLTQHSVDGTLLRVYTETVGGARTAELAAIALARLNELYGPYPWPDLVLAEVGADGGFSMEYPAAIHLTRTKVTDTYVLYHEVAHQWFYAQLGNDQQREPWLDEGFADFTTRYLMGIGENQCSGRPIDSTVFEWPAGPISGGDWQSCDGYFHTVFYRTTEFLNAVRATTGDDAFFGAVRAFIADNRFGMTDGSAMLAALQAATDADLAPLFSRYLATYPP
ncbi:MAG TPA: hypothetical protein VF013_08840 [Candidatus Limnocylindria bacterium]